LSEKLGSLPTKFFLEYLYQITIVIIVFSETIDNWDYGFEDLVHVNLHFNALNNHLVPITTETKTELLK
jgi:hypothetical protein